MINLGQLRSAVGSNDQTLLASIEERNAAYLRDDEECIGLHEPGAPTVRAALGDLISGRLPQKCGASYLLAFDLLCAILGDRLEDDEDCLGDLDSLDLETGLIGSGPPIPLPGLEDRIGFLMANQVGRDADILEAQEAHEDEDIEAARRVLRSFLARARSSGTDLVTITG